MDFAVKEEPLELFIPETLLGSSPDFDTSDLVNCCLCSEGEKYLQSLADHFQAKHPDVHDKSFTHICNCAESLVIQIQLINHLLSHVLNKSERKEPLSLSEAESRTTTDIKLEPEQDNISEDDNSGCFEFKEPKVIKRRNRRPPIANDYTFDPETDKFVCNHCYCKYTTKAKVRQHLHEKHHAPGSAPPTRSRATFRSPFALLGGRAPDNLQCPECSKVCVSAKQLYHHMLTHRAKIFRCDMCSARFNVKQALKKHLITHIQPENRTEQTKLKKEMCDQCSMMINKNKMKRHIANKHSDLRPFECREPGCTSTFKEKRALKEHHNLHTGAKPFRCEYCSESFYHSSILRMHRLRHTNPDRFKCQVCGECFVNNQSLVKHTTRQHPNGDASSDPSLRPFACEYENCESTFRFREHLKAHQRTVHNAKKIEISCDLCSFVSDRRKNYNQHMRRAHGISKRGRKSARVFEPE